MYWPKFSEEKLFRLLREQRGSESGVAAHYVKWTKHTGLKLFTDWRTRDHAMRLQKRAAEAGLAPRLGKERIEFETVAIEFESIKDCPPLRIQKLYGYFTEHCPPIRRWRWGPARDKAEQELTKALRTVGIYHDDLHLGNLSRKSGKLICIDFGPESCYTGAVPPSWWT